MGRTETAIAKYGETACRKAYVMNVKQGEGAYTVAQRVGLASVRSADAAINAGRALHIADELRAFGFLATFAQHGGVDVAGSTQRLYAEYEMMHFLRVRNCFVRPLVAAPVPRHTPTNR